MLQWVPLPSPPPFPISNKLWGFCGRSASLFLIFQAPLPDPGMQRVQSEGITGSDGKLANGKVSSSPPPPIPNKRSRPMMGQSSLAQRQVSLWCDPIHSPLVVLCWVIPTTVSNWLMWIRSFLPEFLTGCCVYGHTWHIFWLTVAGHSCHSACGVYFPHQFPRCCGIWVFTGSHALGSWRWTLGVPTTHSSKSQTTDTFSQCFCSGKCVCVNMCMC